MSAQEREISEGYPTDGRLFQTPQINLDNEKPRYITMLGSLITREEIRERPRLKGGGITISNPCLRYVKNFIRKGRITPLLKDTHNYVPRDIVNIANQGDTSYFDQPIPQGYQPPTMSAPLGPQSVLMGKVALPGQQIESILRGPENVHGNVPRGVVEIQALKGQDYRPQDVGDGLYVDPEIWKLQKAIFPTYPVLPTLVDEVEAILKAAWNTSTGLRDIIEPFQVSLAQFRQFATATVEQSHMTMREVASKTSGYIPQYTSLDLILLEQLGMAQRDSEFRQMAQANKGGTQIGEIKELFSMFLEANREERQELIKAMEKRATSETFMPPDENTMAAAPISEGYSGYGGQSGYSGFSGEVVAADAVEHDVIVNDSPENAERIADAMADTVAAETKSHVCVCGKDFPTPQGLSLHKTRHCEQAKAAQGE